MSHVWNGGHDISAKKPVFEMGRILKNKLSPQRVRVKDYCESITDINL